MRYVPSWSVLVKLLAVPLFLVSAGNAGAATLVFINEFHYDNAGSDTGEFVEVAGPAGTDLAGWSLLLYNGGTGTQYGTVNLSGTLGDEQNGFGTLDFEATGLQNGSPDGFALVDGSNAVVQFLSYEGSFTAADGAANGLSSTDVGVVETTSTPLGWSLQLMGSGTTYEEFLWLGPAAASAGAVNAGQAFGSAPIGGATVPEPGTLLLMSTGMLGLAGRARGRGAAFNE